MKECSICERESERLICETACGHEKCRDCFIQEEEGCALCAKTLQQEDEEDSSTKVVGRDNMPKHITKEIINGIVKYSCLICNKCFKSRSSQYYHLFCDKSMEKPFKCDHCTETFNSKSHLNYHKESHNSQQFECSVCRKVFSKKSILLKHQKLHNRSRVKCAECGSIFLDKDSFTAHMKKHKNEFNFVCATCNKKFTSKSAQTKHENSVHKNNTPKMMCRQCGKLFKHKSALTFHLQKHETPVVNIDCKQCSTSFQDKKSLDRHMKIHQTSLKYECKVCHITSVRKDNLIRHLRNVHDEKDWEKSLKIIREQMCRVYENSSVIRSVGNVEPVFIPPITPVPQSTSSLINEQEQQEMIAKTIEKKYKKKCDPYDLYRQILMADVAEEPKSDEQSKHQSNFSETHWRKNFKENYISESETTHL